MNRCCLVFAALVFSACSSATVNGSVNSSSSSTTGATSTAAASSSGSSGASSASSASASSSSTGSTASSTSSTSSGTASSTSSGSTAASSSSSGGSSGSTGSGSPDAGEIAITVALALDHASYAPGDTVVGTVTYGNIGGASIAIERAVITLRPPGGTHSGGPYDDLSPILGATTFAPGDNVALSASAQLPSSPTGTWEAYSTYQDMSGTYHDGPSVFFSVVAPDAGQVAPADGGYTVVGNTIYDASGNPHLFHGVDRPSLEWSSTGDHLSASDYQLMVSGWHANTVRISLNQDFWLSNAALYDSTYASTVAQQVTWAEQAGLDVILDLHWNDKGDLTDTSPGQQLMADANSVTFWSQVASTFKGDPRVLFELYNEPHDITWDIWLNGGVTTEGWTAHGMQELYDTVRATGANNLVLIGGLDWAYDLSGVATNRVQGTNIVYATHPYYSNNTARPPSDWDRGFGYLTATDPVIATEFGTLDCGTQYVDDFIAYADSHNMSWTSWAWFPSGCGFPSIIADWNGTPEAGMGAHVQTALLGY